MARMPRTARPLDSLELCPEVARRAEQVRANKRPALLDNRLRADHRPQRVELREYNSADLPDNILFDDYKR